MTTGYQSLSSIKTTFVYNAWRRFCRIPVPIPQKAFCELLIRKKDNFLLHTGKAQAFWVIMREKRISCICETEKNTNNCNRPYLGHHI